MRNRIVTALAAFAVLASVAHAGEGADCRDYPLFTRMPGFDCAVSRESDFDAYDFRTNAEGELKAVEGKSYTIQYGLKEGARPVGCLGTIRNYQNVFLKVNGKTLYTAPNDSGYMDAVYTGTFKGKEIWMHVEARPDTIDLHIIEKVAMTQSISVNEMYDAIQGQGFVALHINFDTGKAALKEDGIKAVKDIVGMMKAHPELKLSVEGHTDNAGEPAANKTLSQNRAKAVADAIVKEGVEAKRLSSAGFGQEKPVADNRAETGRAQNRRVELVKK
jgi:outer membrane protein OmpA-like peptidoglycan-associated protein